MKNIAILGSAGNVGIQAAEVVRAHPDKFNITAISAKKNWELLLKQADEFNPKYIGIHDEAAFIRFKQAYTGEAVLLCGESCNSDICAVKAIDTIVNTLTGIAGLVPLLAGVKNGKRVCLSNKESVVCAGELIRKEMDKQPGLVIPVDSEHSAIFHCLGGASPARLQSIILTASGGPFRGWSAERLRDVTPELALSHPTWSMGRKITIDCATLMNKGLEIIEAYWLFGVEKRQIEVVIHPQSIIHGMVRWLDGSVTALMSHPDMRLPIQSALSYPDALPGKNLKPLDFSALSGLTFEAPDYSRFPALRLCLDALNEGGLAPCVLNAADETAVNLFLDHKIGYNDIVSICEDCLARFAGGNLAVTLSSVLDIDKRVREYILMR